MAVLGTIPIWLENAYFPQYRLLRVQISKTFLSPSQLPAMLERVAGRQARANTGDWRAVPDLVGFDVDRTGRVRSWWQKGYPDQDQTEPRFLLPTPNKGYYLYQVHTFKRAEEIPEHRHLQDMTPMVAELTQVAAHRLMLMAFDRMPGPGEVAAFVDGYPQNLALDNLEWRPNIESLGAHR